MKNISRILYILLFPALFLFMPSCNTNLQKEKPNIIYMMADDLGPGDLSHAGQTLFSTPNIDRIASEGMIFRQMYSGNSWCGPSRAVLMTGKHPGHASIRANQLAGNRLECDEETVASILKKAGYTTGVVGKWGVGYDPQTNAPNLHGFDEAYGYINMWHCHNYYPEYLWRNGEKEFLNNKVNHHEANPFWPALTGYAYERNDYTPYLFADEALKFIEKQEGPFFLYLPFIMPHGNGEAQHLGGEYMEIPDLGRFADEPWTRSEQGEAAQIELIDNTVGRILDLLDQKGIADNTMIIFTSDNGGTSGTRFNSTLHFRGRKGTFYEGGLRVPFVLRWPDKVQAGSSTDHVSAFWDFLATCADIAGVDVPEGTDGISFLPTLTGGEQDKHEYLYWELARSAVYEQAVRWGKWKGLRNIDYPKRYLSSYYPELELYNLDQDVGETTNVAADNPDIVLKIEAIMNDAHSHLQGWDLPEFNPDGSKTYK